MTKIVKEVRSVLDMASGAPFDGKAFIAAMAKFSPDHASAASAIIRLCAIELDDGKVVIPA